VTPSPFDFAALRALPRVQRPTLKLAPLPLTIPAPLWFSPLDFASAADIALWALESEALASDQALDEIDTYHAHLDAEQRATVGYVVSEAWIDKPRLSHYCDRCRGDIDLGERHLSQRISGPDGQHTVRVCDYCASPKGSGGESNAERNGTKLYAEAGGQGLCRIKSAGGQAARTKRVETTPF
jgi:hypothetical protein